MNPNKNAPIWILTLFLLFAAAFSPAVFATQTDIIGPVGSGSFGYDYAVLPNGNIVVVDPGYDATASGTGLAATAISLVESDGTVRRARTSSFGYYRFDDIQSGQTVVVSVASKRYQFSPRVVSVVGELSDLDFVPE